MDHFIDSVVATADTVRAELHQNKRINISFDEWNVWYLTRYRNVEQITDIEHWPAAPRICEQQYSVLDGVVVGNLLISLLKHADRVTSASLAQLVNAIAPIMTAWGRCLAADHVLPIRGDLPVGRRVIPRGQTRIRDVPEQAARRGVHRRRRGHP